MKIDIVTIAFVESLLLVTQVIVLFVQFKVHKTYRGLGWWVLGSAVMALGVFFMPLLYVKSVEILAIFANPLVILGQIFLYIGIVHFLDKKENRWLLFSLFIIFLFFYYYYIFVNNSISARTVVVSVTLGVISIMSALILFLRKDRFIASSANFTGAVFSIYGCYLTVRIILTLILPPMHAYSDQETIFIFAFIVPTIISILWTFGFIIMFNQRLNIENLNEKEKMQKIFNISPDAAIITRLRDGLITDVNEGFSIITGYSHDEVIGKVILMTNLWLNKAERETFLTEINKNGKLENMEFAFGRKDGSQFVGMVSARIITIYDVPHIINSVHDITERKLAEQKIQQLVQQLELERNTARLNSITDSLTGLLNRRYFDEAIKTEFYRLKLSGDILSLIILDVDYFKAFNDNYGHLAGDDCLRQIGSLLKTIVDRVSGIVARYGGEEFAIILPKPEVNEAITIAEFIRKAIEELAIPHAASEVGKYVTISTGVVTISTSEFNSPEQVVILADEAMYSAKKDGRNRIVVTHSFS